MILCMAKQGKARPNALGDNKDGGRLVCFVLTLSKAALKNCLSWFYDDSMIISYLVSYSRDKRRQITEINVRANTGIYITCYKLQLQNQQVLLFMVGKLKIDY